MWRTSAGSVVPIRPAGVPPVLHRILKRSQRGFNLQLRIIVGGALSSPGLLIRASLSNFAVVRVSPPLAVRFHLWAVEAQGPAVPSLGRPIALMEPACNTGLEPLQKKPLICICLRRGS